MSWQTTTQRYSPGEEIANSVTHGIGLVLSIAGLAVLMAFASLNGTSWHVISCMIFGITLILLYTASTLYHGLRAPQAKSLMRVLDHSAIFLLIAGTYTPFTLVSMQGVWGWSLFGVVWGLAMIGILFQTTLLRRWLKASLFLYVAMGWAILAAIKPLMAAVAPGGLILLLLGGIAYTSGIVFYVRRSMRYHHAVWHGFVLAGSTLHFFAILFYVIPLAV